ncbi:hypothetical protein ACHAXN_001970 [Cyclotella atomus]
MKQKPQPMSFDEFKAAKHRSQTSTLPKPKPQSIRSQILMNEGIPPVMSFDEFKAHRHSRQQPHDRRSSKGSHRMSSQSKQSKSSSRSALSSRNSNGAAAINKAISKASKVVSNVTSSMATAKAGNVNYGKSNTSSMNTNKHVMKNNSAQVSFNNTSLNINATKDASKRHPDFIEPHSVELTPPRTPYKQVTDYLTDPNTPNCIRGAISAGLAGLSEKKPRQTGEDVFLGLPDGMPGVITWGENWEVDAGFGGKNVQVVADMSSETDAVRRVEDKVESERLSSGRMDSDRSVIHGTISMARTTMSTEGEGMFVDVDEVQQVKERMFVDLEELIEEREDAATAAVYESEEHPPELESVTSEEDEDARNASMWVAAPEDNLDDDTIINLGDIFVDYDDEEAEAPSPVSTGTVHIGDVYSFEEMALDIAVEENALIETESTEEEPAAATTEMAAMSPPSPTIDKLSEKTTNENLPFQTPFSVAKGERPLTFTEFKCMNEDRRVLFDPSVDVDSIQHCAEEFNSMVKPKVKPATMAAERYSTDWLYEENNTPVKVDSGKRQLKGRILLLRIGKKISKVKSKGKNVLKQVFVLPLKGVKREPVTHNSVDNMALTLPNTIPVPMSPSSVSVASIASSVMTGASKRIIGAIPVYRNEPPHLGLQYGAIKYARSGTDSTLGDSLPPPPDILPPPKAADLDEEDAVSYLAAAIMDAGEGELSEEDTASIMATINAQEQLDHDGDESVILVVTPREDQEGSFQVISGFDGVTPIAVKDVMQHLDDDSAIISDLKPNNLQGLFTDKSKSDASFQIMEAGNGIVLTPTTVNHNTSSVFRRSTELPVKAPSIRRSTGTPIVEPNQLTAALPNLLPGSMHDSDDEEDDTLLYHDGDTLVHDGNTLIHHTSTFGDNTIATAGEGDNEEETVEEKREAKEGPSFTPAPKPVDVVALLETPMLSPDQPTLSKQAAKNGSFLFSENNMGRAASRIRAQERAALKEGNVAPSLTMLPAKTMDSKDVNAIVSRLSYTSIASNAPSRLSTESARSYGFAPLIAIEPSVEVNMSSDNSIIKVEIQKKPVVSSMTDAREFSFKTTMNKFTFKPTDEVESPSSLDKSNTSKQAEEIATPLVTNCAQKKKYPVTPFPDALINAESDVDSPVYTEPQRAVSTTESTTLKSSRKKSPRAKPVPKSAIKYKGLVKDRISDIQQRIEGSNSSVTGVGGRLKKNHSYRLKNHRRITSGEGVLAPKQATLRNPIFAARSVPLGISKSYSRDDAEDDAFKYSNDSTKKVVIAKSLSSEKNAAGYASKYIAESVSSPNNCTSPCSIDGSCVSESTEYDPFNTLLGKNTDADEDSSSDDNSSPSTGSKVFFSDNKGKENTNANHLPFKRNALVKPTEINQHDRHVGFASPKHHHAAPLSRNPMEARSWRQLAAAAKEKKAASGRD